MVSFLTCSAVLFPHNVSAWGQHTPKLHTYTYLGCVRLHSRPESLSMIPVPGFRHESPTGLVFWDILGVRCAFANTSFRLFAHLSTN